MSLIWLLAGLAIAYVVLEHGCAERPASSQLDWFQLQAARQLVISKKIRGRGHVDRHGNTRRQQAHT